MSYFYTSSFSNTIIDDLIETIPSYQLQGRKVSEILKIKVLEKDEIIEKKDKNIMDLTDEITLLKEKLAYFKNELYGKKKNKENPEPESDTESSTQKSSEDTSSKEETNVVDIEEAKKKLNEARRKYNKLKRNSSKKVSGKPKPQTLRLRIPDGLYCKSCNCQVFDKGHAGHNSKELDLIPPKIVDRTIISHTGECECGAVKIETPPPVRVVEDTNYSPEFVADLIVKKFRWHLPIYRQHQMLSLSGIDINRSTLNRIVNNAFDQLKPLIKRLKKIAQKQKHKYCDETPICVIKDKKVNVIICGAF